MNPELISKLGSTLDKFSKEVYAIEKKLQSHKLNFPFEWEIEPGVKFGFIKNTISSENRYRIMFINNDYNKPFVECKLEIRVKYAHKLADFIYAFEKHISDIITVFESLKGV